ncbi:hypothetical protein BJV77DRAFT_958643 [Russula vinacea]|nr:hypothetical protein BJV77DRAFT_958643 [Russula vinacea]
MDDRTVKRIWWPDRLRSELDTPTRNPSRVTGDSGLQTVKVWVIGILLAPDAPSLFYRVGTHVRVKSWVLSFGRERRQDFVPMYPQPERLGSSACIVAVHSGNDKAFRNPG